MRPYLVSVCQLDEGGCITGTHHVSRHLAFTPEEAKRIAIEETRVDWLMGDDEPLHVLFVLTALDESEIEVIEYDEGVQS